MSKKLIEPHPWSNTMLLSVGRQTIDGLAGALNTISIERQLLSAALVEISSSSDLTEAREIVRAIFDSHPHLRPTSAVTPFPKKVTP
jgi:hypothetical protein